MKFDMKEFIKEVYGTAKSNEVSTENNYYDWIAYFNHRVISFELKERTDCFPDILVESYQGHRNYKDGDAITGEQLFKIIGWFWKCEADRLIYSNSTWVYDIDWKKFKEFVILHRSEFQTQFCNKSTGAINWIVPLPSIPVDVLKKYNNVWLTKEVVL